MAINYYRETLELLRGAGWIAHANEFEQVVTALRVIRTWAAVDGRRLNAEEIIKIADKALAPLNPPNV